MENGGQQWWSAALLVRGRCDERSGRYCIVRWKGIEVRGPVIILWLGTGSEERSVQSVSKVWSVWSVGSPNPDGTHRAAFFAFWLDRIRPARPVYAGPGRNSPTPPISARRHDPLPPTSPGSPCSLDGYLFQSWKWHRKYYRTWPKIRFNLNKTGNGVLGGEPWEELNEHSIQLFWLSTESFATSHTAIALSNSDPFSINSNYFGIGGVKFDRGCSRTSFVIDKELIERNNVNVFIFIGGLLRG